ncbi:MAG TPA: hypothetical protein VGO86_19045 [Candidatus Dormibacteraeota bacterium]
MPDRQPPDELPNGLPLFNVFVHVPALGARLQLFGIAWTLSIEGFNLHGLLVHPEEYEAMPGAGRSPAVLQLHGEVWTLDRLPRGAGWAVLTRLADGMAFRFEEGPAGLSATGAAGIGLATVASDVFLRDDAAQLRLLSAVFRSVYDDVALSVPLVRPYPGLTSLITRRRPFPRMFAADPPPARAPELPFWPRSPLHLEAG